MYVLQHYNSISSNAPPSEQNFTPNPLIMPHPTLYWGVGINFDECIIASRGGSREGG